MAIDDKWEVFLLSELTFKLVLPLYPSEGPDRIGHRAEPAWASYP
jgi:hypothetical protein